MSKPVIVVKERSVIDPEAYDATQGDMFYIPGYSDKRALRELRIREKGRAAALDHRLQCVVTQDLAGKPDKRKEREWRAKGYRPAQYDELVKLGYRVDKSAFEKRPDGSAGLNEYTVFIADADVASRELSKKQARDDAMQGAAQAKMEEAVADFNRAAGLSGRGASEPISEVTSAEDA